MDLKTGVLAVIEAIVWFFFWYFLDTIRSIVRTDQKQRNLWVAALVLLVLFYLGFIVCPWVRQTEAWDQLFKG